MKIQEKDKNLIRKIKNIFEQEFTNMCYNLGEIEEILNKNQIDFRESISEEFIKYNIIYGSVAIWYNWKEEVMFALKELCLEGKISMVYSSPYSYWYDGYGGVVSSLPIANPNRITTYKNLHWLPVEICRTNVK